MRRRYRGPARSECRPYQQRTESHLPCAQAHFWLHIKICGFLHLRAHLPLRCIAQQSIATIFLSLCIMLLFGLQLLGSLLLLVERWSVLALVLLGPIALNIALFHLLMGPGSFVFALLLGLLESGAIWTCRRYFDSAPTLKERRAR